MSESVFTGFYSPQFPVYSNFCTDNDYTVYAVINLHVYFYITINVCNSTIYMSIFVLSSMYVIVQFLLSLFYFNSETFFPILELEPGVLCMQARALNWGISPTLFILSVMKFL